MRLIQASLRSPSIKGSICRPLGDDMLLCCLEAYRFRGIFDVG